MKNKNKAIIGAITLLAIVTVLHVGFLGYFGPRIYKFDNENNYVGEQYLVIGNNSVQLIRVDPPCSGREPGPTEFPAPCGTFIEYRTIDGSTVKAENGKTNFTLVYDPTYGDLVKVISYTSKTASFSEFDQDPKAVYNINSPFTKTYHRTIATPELLRLILRF